MRIYCEKCKKVFEAEKPEDGKAAVCTFCKAEVPFPESSTSPGAVVGDFLIEKEISRGGMGVVFLARQLSLDRPVALKILQAKFLDDKEYVESFLNEARAAGRINHPNVVQAYAVGEESGIFYFAMEYIRGKTMKEILKDEKTIEFRQAAKIIKEVASALECAWRDEKLVHQDIKPDNIMLDANGFAKLADLGLARVAGNNDKESCEGDEVLGTPQYISPEQLTGIPTDVRSDIYSLGATFYQFITGRFPYVADTAEEIAKLHVAGHLQPPKEVNPALPDELNVIIMKMMARNIEDRYQTPAPLIKALEIYLQHSAPGIGGAAVPQLKFRLPSAGANAAGPGTATPFGARKPATGGLPKATPPKPISPPKPAAAPAAPRPVAKPAVPAPVAKAATAVPQQPAPAAPTPAETPKPVVKSAEEELALKVVPKPETPPTPDVPPEEEGKKKSKGTDASTGKGKKNKPAGKNTGKMVGQIICLLIFFAVLFVVLGCSTYFLAKMDKLPESLKPYGQKLIVLIHGAQEDDASSEPEATELGAVTPPAQPQLPPKPVDLTRPEYLAGIEALLNQYQTNPNDRIGFLEACDRFFLNFATPRSPKETEALRPLQGVYHKVDESARVAPARAAARAEFEKQLGERHQKQDVIRKAEEDKQEAERLRKEAAAEEARRLAEEKAKQDAENQAAAADRLAQVRPQLEQLFGKVANEFLIAIRSGKTDTFQKGLTELRFFPFTPGSSVEEVRLLSQITAFGGQLPEEQKKLRAFVERLGQISPSKDSFSLEMPNHDLVTIVGVTPYSITAVDGSGKPVPFDLSNPQVRALFLQRLERRLKLEKPTLYLDLMSGNFTEETAKAADQYNNFWKTYYKPFLTAWLSDRLRNADAAGKKDLENRYGKLPEFQAAKQEMGK